MSKSSRKCLGVKLTVLVMAVAGAVISLWTLSVVSVLSFNLPYLQPSKSLRVVKDRLDVALENASMANKTVIIAIVNKAYVEGDDSNMTNMLDLFLESLRAGDGTRWLINHLLVVAVDKVAYRRCLFRGLHCYELQTYGMNLANEEVYMSREFINMMWLRTLFLTHVLKKGYNFIFTDVDVMWLRNPLPLLKPDSIDIDIHFSVDNYNGQASAFHPINTGFYFIHSNNRTIALFQNWYAVKDRSISGGLKEQDVLQTLIHGGVLHRLDLKVTFLPTRFFSGFCQESDDLRVVVTVHANCCRYISAKVADLSRVLRDWRQFRRMSVGEASKMRWSNRARCHESWRTNFGGAFLKERRVRSPGVKVVASSYEYVSNPSGSTTLLYRDKFSS